MKDSTGATNAAANRADGPIGLAMDGTAIFGNTDMNGNAAYIYEGYSMCPALSHADPTNHQVILLIIAILESLPY